MKQVIFRLLLCLAALSLLGGRALAAEGKIGRAHV